MADKGKPKFDDYSLVVAPMGEEEESNSTGTRRSSYLRKRRRALWCCSGCGAIIVILGTIALVLAFTIFKIENPELTMNSIRINSLRFNADGLNATLNADVSIKNPNAASFSFDQSTTEFFYGNESVGIGYVPAGKVGAHRTARMSVEIDVLANRVVGRKASVLAALLGQEFNVTSYTVINGRVNVLKVYKRDVHVLLNCSMTIDASITLQELKNKDCVATVE